VSYLGGFADPWVDSNAKRLNPNRTVTEWLYRNPRFEGKSATFGAWTTFPFAFMTLHRRGIYGRTGLVVPENGFPFTSTSAIVRFTIFDFLQ